MLRPELHVETVGNWLKKTSEGETRFRLVAESDAAFILRLRTDPVKSRNLSETKNCLEAQQIWLRAYLARFKAGREAYFIIENKGVSCGTVRLYDYRPSDDSFSWGSWIITAEASPAVGLRSALMVYDLAFGPLGFERSHFDVRQANLSVWRFHERMGASLLKADEINRHYVYNSADYLHKRVELARHAQGRLWVDGSPKICIAGKNDIAADCLLGLLKCGYAPADLCVVANRGDIGRHTWQKSLVATARQHGIRVWPVAAVQQLPDIRFFSLEHDRILRPAAFRSPHLYNLHFSLLPAYRGVATSVWPLRLCEKKSGVTLHRIDAGIDTGRVIAQTAFTLSPSMKASELYNEYIRQGRRLFFAELDRLMTSAPEGRPQDGEASYYPRSMINYADLSIDYARPIKEVLASIKSRIFWQYQLPAYEGRRIWDASEAPFVTDLFPGQCRVIDGWSDFVGVHGGAVRLEYSFMDALMQWAVGGPCPACPPRDIPDLQTEDARGWTPLMVAAYNGQAPALRWLLAAGADPNHQNRRGSSPLMYAKSFAQKSGDLEPLRILLANGARVGAKDQYGLTAADYCDPTADEHIFSLLHS
jgi:methionyl-tRNA formyltransferase